MKKKNHLKYLENKLIINFDLKFLDKVKDTFPYYNAYFLVCFVETLHRFIAEEKYFSSYDKAFESLIDEASELYLGTNISSLLRNVNVSKY